MIAITKILRGTALGLLAAGVAGWWVAGANRGWTKTSVPVKTTDEVTGLEGIAYQKRFLPGVDFLAVVVGAAGALAGVSFLSWRKPKHP